MQAFETKRLPLTCDVIAPDGSEVRVLLGCNGGSMAHFRLATGAVSKAVTHRTVEEIWYVLAGHGEMWRQSDQEEAVVTLEPGVCVTIPVGTRFQFRATECVALEAVAITMPPWPGDGEAVATVEPWKTTLA